MIGEIAEKYCIYAVFSGLGFRIQSFQDFGFRV